MLLNVNRKILNKMNKVEMYIGKNKEYIFINFPTLNKVPDSIEK
jgi:hypothetical protein